MKNIKMKLRVMADVESSGIWVIALEHSRERHMMIDYNELSLPQELAGKFAAWIESYWQYIDNKEHFDFASFNRTGKQLAKELKSFLGNAYYVEFEGEAELHTLKGEEIF